MSRLTIEIQKIKEVEFLNFLSNFDYVKIKDRKKIKDTFKINLTHALKEVEEMENELLEKGNIADFYISPLIDWTKMKQI